MVVAISFNFVADIYRKSHFWQHKTQHPITNTDRAIWFGLLCFPAYSPHNLYKTIFGVNFFFGVI